MLARAKKLPTKGFEQREAIFDLFVSGFSHQQIAMALGTSVAVRRIIDSAVAERRPDAPEQHVHAQVASLMKALSHADDKLEKGDIRPFGPCREIMTALDRYHALGAADRRGRVRAPGRRAPPLRTRRARAGAAAARLDPRRSAARPRLRSARRPLWHSTH